MNPSGHDHEHPHTHHYPPYNIYVHVTILTIITAYIPVIIVSSSFVIAAVFYISRLHNSHNYILVALSAADLLVALVIIPSYVLMGIHPTREFIYHNLFLCRVVHTLQDCIETTGLFFLTLLGLDTFVQIRWPIHYRKHSTKKNVQICILTIIVLNLCSSVAFFGIAIFGDFSCGSETDRFHSVHQEVTFSALLVVCFLSGVYVRVVSCRRGHTKSQKITMVLMMLFIIFYTPTVVLFFNLHNLSESQQELCLYSSRAIRYLCPLTNGIFIYMSRHVYNTAFRFFIKTHPRYWYRIEKTMTMSTLSSFHHRKSRLPSDILALPLSGGFNSEKRKVSIPNKPSSDPISPDTSTLTCVSSQKNSLNVLQTLINPEATRCSVNTKSSDCNNPNL